MTRKRFKCHYLQIKKTLGGKNVVESLMEQMWQKQMIIHPMFPFDMMDIMFVVGLYLGLLSDLWLINMSRELWLIRRSVHKLFDVKSLNNSKLSEWKNNSNRSSLSSYQRLHSSGIPTAISSSVAPLAPEITRRSLSIVWVGGIKRDGSDKQQEVNIKKVRNHPQYDKQSSDHDITILELRLVLILESLLP